MTLYSTNQRGLCITDHHDVTEEDVYWANLGRDAPYFGEDWHQPQPRPKRSAEWWRQYHASRKGFGP